MCTTSKVMLTSLTPPEAKLCAENNAPASMSRELHSRGEVMLLPQQVDKLLFPKDHCTCDLEWHCVPHNTCFIHNSCFCKGSGSFPPIKPPCPSWAEFLYDWYCELASCLKLHPHPPLPHFGSEVEYSPLVMPYYHYLPPV